MPRNFWPRIALVAVVILASLWYLYPPHKRINLGLDLQGGIHLVLGVDIEKALATHTERLGADFKSALERKGIGVTRVAREGAAALGVQLASPQSWNDALTVSGEFPSLERRNEDQATGRFVLAMRSSEVNRLRDEFVRQAVETIRNRIDQFGVAEPTITRTGENRILIQLPGLQDPDRAKGLIGRTALLEFKLVDDRTPAEAAQRGQLPEGSELLYQRRVDKATKTEQKTPIVVQKRSLLTGAELTRAEVAADPNATGNWQVAIELSPEGARRFGEITEQNVGKQLAIILDGNVYSAPRINERIPGGRAVITVQFTIEEARPRHRPARGRPAGARHRARGADGGALAGRRLHPPGGHRDHDLGGPGLHLHGLLLPALWPHRRRRPRPQPAHPDGLDGRLRRDPHAAGPGRHRAHHRHGCRHQHPDLRADPGGAAR